MQLLFPQKEWFEISTCIKYAFEQSSLTGISVVVLYAITGYIILPRLIMMVYLTLKFWATKIKFCWTKP